MEKDRDVLESMQGVEGEDPRHENEASQELVDIGIWVRAVNA